MKSIILTSFLIGLAAGAPRPQDIDFDLAFALPNPTYSKAAGATAQSVVIDPSVVYSAAAAQITATDADTAGIPTATADIAHVKRAACASLPVAAGPVPCPDTIAAFLAYPSFASIASVATTPSGYTAQYLNQAGSSNAEVDTSSVLYSTKC
ncbi:hypothetical protein E4T42_09036 [Aureobasidium subglaciale]|nr:hypothetical protein E4T42_09036 [Aureobasidium subglaciale]